MKILNLHAGAGGNRKYWGDEHNITAVEINSHIAGVYQKLYTNDTVIGDASAYLQSHYKEYDFIWDSPPCPSHGQYRHNVGVIGKGFNPLIPDMTLYAHIVFLSTYFKGLYCVENVRPYYTPLIQPSIELQRHFIWSNFSIDSKDFDTSNIRRKNKLSDFDGFEIIAESNIKNKRQVLRNMVNPLLGKYILDSAIKYSE